MQSKDQRHGKKYLHIPRGVWARDLNLEHRPILCFLTMDGSARGRGEQPKDPAGDDFLLQDCVAENLAATITARDMACLCLASPRLRRGVPGLVRLAMEARHGLWIAGNATRDLHFLDKTPTTLSLDFRQRDAVRVEQGSALCSTMVGGEEDLITLAQLPPRRGDAWSADVALQRGIYSLKIAGWRNPYHGVLDFFLDGKPVTPADGFDWSGPCTAPASHEAEIAIKWTGVHQLLGKTSRSKVSRRRHKRFWMCLKCLTITPAQA